MEGPLHHTVRNWSDLVRAIDGTYQIFERLGVSTLRSSRIAAYRQLCHDFARAQHNPKNFGLERTTRLLHAAVEVDQLLLIASAAAENPAVWVTRLEHLIAGPAFPLEAKREARARDTQYECFLAAVAQLAGYCICFNEPDIAVSSNGVNVGIAAKRPRHISTVQKNCHRAVRQIRSVGGKGIVALDVTTALFWDFCVNTSDPIGAKTVVADLLRKFVDAHASQLRAECAQDSIIGVLVTAYAPALVYHADGPPTLYTTKVWSAVDLASAEAKDRYWFAQFVSRAHEACFVTPAVQ